MNTPRNDKDLLRTVQDRINDFEEKASQQINALVEKGRQYEQVRKVEAKVEELSVKMRESQTVQKANDLTNQLEKKLEQGLEKAFTTVGLATKTEVERLNRRLKDLSKKVKGLVEKQP